MGCSVSTPDPPIPPVLQPRSKNVKRKAFVIIRPWTNEEQNKWFSNIHIDKSEEYVSRTFNIEVREIKNSTTEVNSRLATETDTTPSDMFKFQYNSEQLNEVVYIHSGIDITSECGKTHDFIKLSMEVRIVKNHVIYTLHQYNGTEWIKTEIEQKAGQATVEVDMYEIVTTETILFTMRYISEEITIPPQGYEHENEYCRNQRITFQEGAVGDNKQLGITTLSLEDECDQKRLKKQMKSKNVLTDARNTTVRLELDPVINTDGSTTTNLFECDNDGNVRLKLGVNIQQVHREEVTDNSVYGMPVDTLNRVGLFRSTPTENRSMNNTSLMTTFGLGKDQCRILTFLSGEGPERRIWVDVVQERKWKTRNKELSERKNMFELVDTVSPSVSMENRSKTEITLPESNQIAVDSVVPKDSLVVYYDQSASEIYTYFPIVKNQKAKSDIAIVQYHINDYIIHTAYFKLRPDQMPLSVIQNEEFFGKSSMGVLARKITTSKMTELMLQLGIRLYKIENFHMEYSDHFTFKLKLLNYWSHEKEASSPRTKLTVLCNALRYAGLMIFAEVLERVYEEGRGLRPEDFENV